MDVVVDKEGAAAASPQARAGDTDSWTNLDTFSGHVGRVFPGRSRPLCAYPTYAHYKGSGEPEDAKNFECRN